MILEGTWTDAHTQAFVALAKRLGVKQRAINSIVHSLKVPPLRRKSPSFRNPQPGDWTDAETKTLVAMFADGYSRPKIGKAIGKTTESVRGKIRRLGLVRNLGPAE